MTMDDQKVFLWLVEVSRQNLAHICRLCQFHISVGHLSIVLSSAEFFLAI